jgi:hypothetical protein
LKLTRDELNRLRDLILKELGKVNVEPSKEFPVAFWATWGEHPATGARAHAEMVTDYIEGKGSMVEIGRVHEVSNATVHNHTKSHNRDIHNAGECPRCRRVDSEYSKTWAKRPRKKKIIN